MKLLTINEAAAYVRLHPNTVRNLLKKKKMPGAKAGARWRIDETELEEWLRGQYTNSARVQPNDKEDEWHSSAEQVFTTSSSKGRTADQLSALLERETKPKPKNTTTS